MSTLYFLSHPQVRISADVPVPRWGLTEQGRSRVGSLIGRPWLATVTHLLSSSETKALETAAIIATGTGLSIDVRDDLGENDRSATGFVPPEQFEALADSFFAHPDRSTKGWETARDAQRRVVACTAGLLVDGTGDVIISGHGGVGTLLLCHLLDAPISRSHDQNRGDAAPGGGNYWSYDRTRRRVVQGWRPIEELGGLQAGDLPDAGR